MSAVAYRHHDVENARYLKLAASAVEILGREQAEDLAREFARLASIMASLTESGYSFENYTTAINGIIASHKSGRPLRFSDAVEAQTNIEKLLKNIPATNDHNVKLRLSLNNSLNNIKRILNGHFEPKIQKKAEVKSVKVLNDILNKIPPKLRGDILASLTSEKREVNIGNIVRALATNKSDLALTSIGDILVMLAAKKELSKFFGQAVTALAEGKNLQTISQIVDKLSNNHPEVATRTATAAIDVLAKISPELASQTIAAVIDKIAVNHPEVTTKFIALLTDTHPEILKTATLALADERKIPAVAAVLAAMADGKLSLRTTSLVTDKLAATTAPEVVTKFIAALAEKQPDIVRNARPQMADKQSAIVQQIAKAKVAISPKLPLREIMGSIAETRKDISRTAILVNTGNGQTPSPVIKADFKGSAFLTGGDKLSVSTLVSSRAARVISFPSKSEPSQPRNFGQVPSTAPDTGSASAPASSVNKEYKGSPSFSDGQSSPQAGVGGVVGNSPSAGTLSAPDGKVGGIQPTGTESGPPVAADGATSAPPVGKDTTQTAGNGSHTPAPTPSLHPEQWNRTERETTVDLSVRETDILQAEATGKDKSTLTPEGITNKDAGVGSLSDTGDVFAGLDLSSVNHGTAPEVLRQSIDDFFGDGNGKNPTLFDAGEPIEQDKLADIKPPPRPTGIPKCCETDEAKPQ